MSGKSELPKAPACQAPYVNVFKHFAVDDWKLASREGCVEPVMDKLIGKKVLRIMGNVLAANYMRLPRKNGHSLGLTGRYLYTQVRTVPDKYFVLHLYVQGKDDTVLDISITNLFKELKVIGNVLQYPCPLAPKWTCVCVDLVEMMSQHKNMQYKCLKGIQVCSNIFVRNVFTSDTLYTPNRLPKDFAFPMSQGRELDSFYGWQSVPERKKSFKDAENDSPQAGALPRAGSLGLKDKVEGCPDVAALFLGKASLLRPSMHSMGASTYSLRGTSRDSSRVDLGPDPALELRWCIGHSGKSPYSMIWSHDSRWILYPCASLIVAMNPETSQQRFFIGHTADVTVMAVGPDDQLLASCQEGKSPLIRLWDFASGDCVSMLGAHGRDVACIGFNRDGLRMVAVGKEDKGAARNFLNCVVIWDISKVARGGKAVKVADQTFEPSLNKIGFTPFEDGHLVSCGADNIHLWRVKVVKQKEELRKIALPLGPHGGENFLDLAFEGTLGGADPFSRKIYASTGSGLVYQINYTNRVVEQIYRLHDAGINALVVTDGFCVTGSEDRFLRVWPLDFSDYFLEAQHAAPVTSVGVSSDCLKIAISTQNGTVGVMDVPSHGYRTVVRSHENTVCALAMDPNNREFTTTAADGTIRTWDLDSYDQLYEFLAPGECARCVEYHPSKYVMACGFDNGAVRIFDMATTSQLHEYRQHQGRVMALAFSSDGSRLFSAATDGHFCVYDAPRNYQPIKTVACSHAGDSVSLALSANGKMMAALGVHGASLLILNAETMDTLLEVPCGGRNLRLLKFSPVSNEVYGITSCCRLQRYSLDSGELAHESAPLHLDTILTMDVSDNGKLLLTGGNEGLVKLWALSNGGPTERRSQTFIGHPAAVTRVGFTADKKQVVSAGMGCGILVWDLLADAAEDLSDYVDRIVDERAAEQQRLEMEANVALQESSEPVLPALGVEMDADSLLDTLRNKVRAEEADSEAGTVSEYGADNALLSEPSPLARVRERALHLDLSGTPVHSHMGERSGIDLEDSASNLPLIHYRRRRPSAKRAERKFVAPDDEAGLKMVHMIGLNTAGHDNLVWHPERGLLCMGVGSTVVVDNLETGVRRFMQGHDTEISCLSLSSDGMMLASARGSADTAVPPVMVWALDQDKPEPLLQLNCHHQGVQALAWSPDGRFLLSVGTCLDGKMAVLSMDTREAVITADCPHPIHAAKFGALGLEVVTAGHMYVTFWRFKMEGGKLQASREEREAPNEERGVHYTCVDLAPDGSTFFVGSVTGGVSQWTITPSGPLCTGSWNTDQGELSSLQCKGLRVVTCGQRPHMRMWEHFSDATGDGYWQVVREITLDSVVTSLSMDDLGVEGVASTSAGTVWRVGGDNPNPAARIAGGHGAKVTGLAFAEAGDLAASCAADGSVLVWAVAGMELLRGFRVECECRCVAFAPSGRSVAAGFQDGVVRHLVVGSAAGTSSDATVVSDSDVTAVVFANQGESLMCGTAGGTISCSHLASGQLQPISACPPTQSPVCCLRVSNDGTDTWLATYANGLIRVFKHDYWSGASVLLHQDLPNNDAPIYADFSPSEQHIIVCAGPGLGPGIYFYDLDLKQVVNRFGDMDQVATSLTVSPSGTLITMGTDERLVKVVDYDEGTFQDFTGHADAVSCMCFSPTGDTLITSADTDIVQWSVRI